MNDIQSGPAQKLLVYSEVALRLLWGPPPELVNDQQLLTEIGFTIERQFSSHGKTYQYRIGRHQ
jgi:hypothetical protein